MEIGKEKKNAEFTVRNSQSSPPFGADESESLVIPDLPASLAQKKSAVDPVTEVCLDMQVKIADLGNACWVVSC